MYHIKNDKRCKRSADRIGKALRELLTVKSLNDISVTDIQKTSGVGRSTFYRLFDNIDDVLLYETEEEFRGMIELYKEMDWAEFSEHFISGVVSESKVIINIAASDKMHIVSKSLRTGLTHAAEQNSYVFDSLSKYMIAIFVGGCISLVTAWEENGRKESIDELAKIMRQAFNYKDMTSSLTRPVQKNK